VAPAAGLETDQPERWLTFGVGVGKAEDERFSGDELLEKLWYDSSKFCLLQTAICLRQLLVNYKINTLAANPDGFAETL
jgi:hypothetical protein